MFRVASLCVVAIAGLLACSSDSRDAATLIEAESSLRAVTESVAEVLLEQTDSAFIVYPSGIDVSEGGDVLIADASEGNVKWYDQDGRLKRVLGRKGSGPAEFRMPYFPRFSASGSIYVVDIGDGTTLSTFRSDGSYVNRVSLNAVRTVGHVEILSDSSLLVAGRSSDAADLNVLFEVSTSGSILRRWLPVRDVTPTGGEDMAFWRGQAAASFALKGDTAFVVSSASDSLWVVDLSSGATQLLA